MSREYNEKIEPASASITYPKNNAMVPLGDIPVSGTTSLGNSMPVVVKLYKSSVLVEATTAGVTGNTWAVTLTGQHPPGTYLLEVSQVAPTRIAFTLEVPAPIIDVPLTNGLIDMPVTVTGKNGLYSHGSISLYTSPGNVLIKGGIVVASNGGWTTSITLPANVSGFVAKQKVGIYESGPSAAVTGLRLNPPIIEKPLPNETVSARPEFRGKGIPGSKVTVWQTGTNIPLVTDAPVGADRVWFKTSEVALSGTVGIKAKVKLNGLESPDTPERIFTAAPDSPLITLPAAGSLQDTTFTVSGTKGVVGATVHVLLDLVNPPVEVGNSVVLTGVAWTASVTVTPGPVSLVAKQVKGGYESGRGNAVAFKIRPPRVVLQPTSVDANGSVTIKGTGHVGADLDIHYVYDDKVLHTFPVTETPWSKTFPGWLPGSYSIGARQRVKGIGNELIFSEWTLAAADFTVKVPPPTLTHTVGVDQKPVFSGMGNSWVGQPAAQVEVRLFGTPAPVVPIATVVGGRWSSAATEPWAPGTHSVVARQLFEATDKPKLESDWTSEISVVIRAPLPSIDAITENDLSPEIAGTCWKGAVVTLVFSDNTMQQHPVPDFDNDGNWTFRRPQPFQPGSYTVTATQTFGGQTSNEVTKRFTVKVSTPVIKPITVPVGQNPEIEGHGGVADAQMTIFDYVTELPLGDAPVSGDNWRVPLNELEFRRYDIYAVQKINGIPSERSERIQFEVMLLPPVVDTPKPKDEVARTFRIEGHASRASGSDVAQVHVWLEGGTEPWARIPVRYDGVWGFDATLPLGTQTLKFKQHFKGKESAFSEILVIGVVPAKPVIETPANGEAVESCLAISGFGFPGDTVGVAYADDRDVELGSTKVLENCTWSLWLSLERPAGHPELVAQQHFGDYLSGWTTPREVELRTHPPQFTAPLPCRWVESKLTFAGTAGAGGNVFLYAWFDPDKMLASSSVVDEGWEVTPSRDLLQDEHWARAVHRTDEERQTSATADSPRFEVLPAKENGTDSAS